MRIGVACLLLSSSSLAFQLPFKLPFFQSDSVTQEVLEAEVPAITQPRIAIIGAGAGGSSAAWWISKAKERYGFDVQVDVFDKSDYIGGSAYLNDPDRAAAANEPFPRKHNCIPVQ